MSEVSPEATIKDLLVSPATFIFVLLSFLALPFAYIAGMYGGEWTAHQVTSILRHKND
jgi:hypothetical protein